MEYKYNKDLWQEIITNGRKGSKSPQRNLLNKDDITTVMASMDFFGATKAFMNQSYFDLTMAKFKVFDWLAMAINGRNDDNREQNEPSTKVFIQAFRDGKYTEEGFIQALREKDYQIITEWEKIEIDEKENKPYKSISGARP